MPQAPSHFVPDEELTAYEQEWVNELAILMARGFGSLTRQNGRPTLVRSGVYRGVVSALVPIYDEIADHPQDGVLYEVGIEAGKKALWDSRVCPNQT